jgi:ABC-type transporter Mla subunit MlaD
VSVLLIVALVVLALVLLAVAVGWVDSRRRRKPPPEYVERERVGW